MSPDDPRLEELCGRLSEQADRLDVRGDWPAAQLRLCGEYGVYRWFLPSRWGGGEWDEPDLLRGYLRLAEACLTTTFIITQRSAACRRMAVSENEALKDRLLPDLAAGEAFATVAISHLTTSRRHLGRPALSARDDGQALFLDGFSAWVTGAKHAQTIVVGAVLDDGRQVLAAVPADWPGLEICEPARLAGLSASHTGEIRCRHVRVGREWLVAGPVENVMSVSGSSTGGLQTSALAVGLSRAALQFLKTEAQTRNNLWEAAGSLEAEEAELRADLLRVGAGEPICSADDLRARANSLVLRVTQAALAAAKGTGYLVGHPAGRWCREALFFLVWSCPQPVVSANLCELAGLE